VISAVRAVARGQAVFGAALAARVLGIFADRPVEADRATQFPQLSVREREVLEHVARGLSNQQIADVLVISPITVRNHVSSILAKLQVSDRRQAMLRAREGR
jgi:DNA-binding NarL/FixJ family response regulator